VTRSAPLLHATGPLVAALLLATPDPTARAAGPAPATPPPTLAVLVAQTFLRAVADRDAERALPLLSDTVDFDGQVATGPAAVKAQLGAMLKRMAAPRELRRVVVLTLAQATARFGPPPARLKLPKGELVVGLGRFFHGGLIVLVAPEGERYRVVAITD
jgi:hypothetical protein